MTYDHRAACGRLTVHGRVAFVLTLSVLPLSCLFLSVSARAAEVQEQPEPALVQEIVVTAQRREQRLLDTPLAISAVSARDLEQKGFNNIVDLGNTIPNVEFNQGSGTVNQFIAIRGNAQPNDALFFDQPVGIYIDGVYVAKSEGGLFDIGDLDRIEVLRGPQGTLYGRNTLAGAVNLVTHRPDGEPGATATASFGNYGQVGSRVTLASPWIGNVALRGTIDYRKHDGFVKNHPDPFGTPGALAPQTNELAALDSLAGRFALRAKPTEALTVDYTFDFNRQHNKQQYAALTSFNHFDGASRPICVPGAAADPRYRCPAGSGGVPGLLDIFDPASPSYIGVNLTPYIKTGRSLDSSVDQPQDETSHVEGHALQARWAVGSFELKSITSYRSLRSTRDTDFDGSPVNLISGTLLNTFHAYSEEFQVNGSVDQVNISSGLYYYSDSGHSHIVLHVLSPGVLDTSFDTGTTAYAAYAQADWTPRILEDRLTVTGGLRYTNERKTAGRFIAVDPPGLAPIVLLPNLQTHASFGRGTPTATLAFKVAPNVNAYARYASGFKSGGFSGQAFTADESLRPFGAETVQSYEAGLKARLFDGMVDLSSAFFIEEHKNQQILIIDNSRGTLSNVIRNAGQAENKGIELEGSFVPTRRVRLGFSIGYLDAKFKKFVTDAGDQAGNRVVPFAPKYNLTTYADVILAEGDFGQLRLHADYTRTGQQYAQAFLLHPNLLSTNSNDWPDARGQALIPAYGLVNGRLSLENLQVGKSTLEVALFVKNIADEKYRTQAIPLGDATGGLTDFFYGPPRTYGVEMTARF